MNPKEDHAKNSAASSQSTALTSEEIERADAQAEAMRDVVRESGGTQRIAQDVAVVGEKASPVHSRAIATPSRKASAVGGGGQRYSTHATDTTLQNPYARASYRAPERLSVAEKEKEHAGAGAEESTGHKALQAASDAVQGLEIKAHDAKDVAVGVWDRTKEATSSIVDQSKQGVQNALQAANTQAHEASDLTRDALHEVLEGPQDSSTAALPDSEILDSTAKQVASPVEAERADRATWDAVKDATDHARDQTKQVSSDVAQAVADKAIAAKDATSAKYEEAKQASSDAAHAANVKLKQAGQTAADTAERLETRVETAAENAALSASATAAEAKQGAEKKYDAAKQGAEEKYDAAKQGAEEKYDAAKQGAEEKYDAAKLAVGETIADASHKVDEAEASAGQKWDQTKRGSQILGGVARGKDNPAAIAVGAQPDAAKAASEEAHAKNSATAFAQRVNEAVDEASKA